MIVNNTIGKHLINSDVAKRGFGYSNPSMAFFLYFGINVLTKQMYFNLYYYNYI